MSPTLEARRKLADDARADLHNMPLPLVSSDATSSAPPEVLAKPQMEVKLAVAAAVIFAVAAIILLAMSFAGSSAFAQPVVGLAAAGIAGLCALAAASLKGK